MAQSGQAEDQGKSQQMEIVLELDFSKRKFRLSEHPECTIGQHDCVLITNITQSRPNCLMVSYGAQKPGWEIPPDIEITMDDIENGFVIIRLTPNDQEEYIFPHHENGDDKDEYFLAVHLKTLREICDMLGLDQNTILRIQPRKE